MVDHNIKDGDVIEVAPRARGSIADLNEATPDLQDNEVKRILYNTGQFIENVLDVYNDMLLEYDNFDESKEKIHKEIKRFMKLRKQASPSHVQNQSVKKLAKDLDRDLASSLKEGAMYSKIEKKEKKAKEENEERKNKILEKSDNILERISWLFDECSDESGTLPEECEQFKNSPDANFLTDYCVNMTHQDTDLICSRVVKVGASVLQVRRDVLNHFEQTAERLKGKEETDKARNSRIQEAFERKKIQFEELDKKHAQVLKENEGLKEELGVASAELNSIRSESEVHVSNLEKDLEKSNKSLDNVTADLTRATQALSSLSKDRNKLAEEVHNIKPLNENLAKEAESLQRDVKALKEDQALQREKEQMFSSLKNHMAKKLEEKEVVIAEKNGQLKAVKNELFQEKERAQSTEEDIITLDAPFDKQNRMLEQRISEQRKKLSSSMRKEERLKSEVKQHTTNLAMIKCGVNQLVNDPTTPSSVIRSLMLLKHSSMFSIEDTKEGPEEKKVKLEVKEEYQEYFEHAHVKQDNPPAPETEQEGLKNLEVSEGAQMGVSVTEVGDVAILQEERTEPNGPKIMESDGMQVE